MARKKILFVVEAMGGGVFTYIVDMANELVKKYDMYIAYAVRKQTPGNYRDYFDKRVQLIHIDSLKRAISPVHDVIALFKLRKLAKQIGPDVIHLHSSKAGALGRLAFQNYGIPLFYTPHGYSFLMKNHGPAKRYLYRTIEHICGLLNCTTISCSSGEYQESLKLTRQVACVDNGINLEILQKEIDAGLIDVETDGNKKHDFTVFTLGRICYQKNPGLFNEIAEALPDIRFLWIGDGELRDKLYSSNITITGWVDRSRAIRLSLSADVFLLTSLWEGLPMSLLEAMYMKKPCVVSNVIGSRDVVKQGINGYICENALEFVGAIKEIRERFPYDLTEAAYASVCSHYNVFEMVKQYEQIYFP